jgi:hypothetical protein
LGQEILSRLPDSISRALLLFYPNLSVCLFVFSFRVFIFTDQFFGSSAKITQLHFDAFIDKDKCGAAERRRQIATTFRA